jgi:hypothetical protein
MTNDVIKKVVEIIKEHVEDESDRARIYVDLIEFLEEEGHDDIEELSELDIVFMDVYDSLNEDDDEAFDLDDYFGDDEVEKEN